MRATAFFVGVALGCVTGCTQSRPLSRFPTGEAALSRMKETHACANGVQGAGKLDHFGTRGRIRGDASVIAVNPARVRIDISSPFGATPYTLTSNGQSFTLNDLPNKQLLFGRASACNLARLTQVLIAGHALVSLLRGEAPLLKHDARAASLDWEDGHYRIELPSHHGARQTVLLEVYAEDYAVDWQKQRVRVVGVSTVQSGAVLYEAELGNFVRAVTAAPRNDEDGLDPMILPSGGPCALDIPRSIRLKVPHSGDDVLFQYRSVVLNPPLPVGTFTQPVPAGAHEQRVECDGP